MHRGKTRSTTRHPHELFAAIFGEATAETLRIRKVAPKDVALSRSTDSQVDEGSPQTTTEFSGSLTVPPNVVPEISPKNGENCPTTDAKKGLPAQKAAILSPKGKRKRQKSAFSLTEFSFAGWNSV